MNIVHKSYCQAILYALFIFISIQYVRTFQKFVKAAFGRSIFAYFVLTAFGVLSIAVFCFLRRNLKNRITIYNYIWLGLVAGLYVFSTIHLWKSPEESVHFLEYALMSFLAYNALSHHIKDGTIFVTATLVTLFIGSLDEMFQWFAEGRYGSFRDIRMDVWAGALMQVALWKGIRPREIDGKIHHTSVKILSSVALACVLILGLLAVCTPSRIYFFSERFPAFSFLRQQHDIMSEYGYKLHDPEIGMFYSRLTKQDLIRIDLRQNQRYSEILDQNKRLVYNDFLKTFNPISSPFLYEMRIHIFRRDTYFDKSRNSSNRLQKQEYQTIAFKENLILEKYFGKTLGKSVYQWSESRKGIMDRVDKNRYYESPVSSELFTLFTESHLIGGIVMSIFLTGWAFFRYKSKVDEECI